MDLFKLQEKNTNFLAEMIAGMTTFITMSYLLLQCASVLSGAGLKESSAYLAICIAAAAGCLIVGFWANQPLVLAPSLGMTVFFTSTLVQELHYTYPQALTVTLIGGLIFLGMSATGLQDAIYGAIPGGIKNALSAGLGIYIALLGLRNAGLIVYGDNGLWKLVDFSEPSKTLFTTIVMLIGLMLIILLKQFRVPFPVLLGMLSSGAVYYIVGAKRHYISSVNLNPSSDAFGGHLAGWASDSLFKNLTDGLTTIFDGLTFNLRTVLSVMLVLMVCAVFNSMESTGVIYATARSGGMLDDKGNFGGLPRTMFANSLGSVASSCFGAPMITVTAESGAGISVGGKSGLTAITAGVLCLAAAVFTPAVEIIPTTVTACAMVYVGMSMLGAMKDVDFGDVSEAIPAVVTLMVITFTSSIMDGIAVGMLLHIAGKLVTFQFKSLKVMEIALGMLFAAAYYFM